MLTRQMRRVLLTVGVAGLLLGACDAEQPPDSRRVRYADGRAPTPEPGGASAAPPQAPTAPADPFDLAARYRFPDPETLTERLVEAERAIRDPDTPREELPEHGRVQQGAYRQLVREPAWREGVIDALPGHLRPAASANLEAGRLLIEMTRPADELPEDWRILSPPEPAELRRHYAEAQERYGVPWEYLAAIHLVETRMSRIAGESHAGARGPMQFMPPTWEQYGEGDVTDTRDAVLAAARYLRANGAPGDMGAALFAYNRKREYVEAVRLHAEVMRQEERAFLGYHGWEVYYQTTRGDALLLPGWGS